jgi:hypothetical protein
MSTLFYKKGFAIIDAPINNAIFDLCATYRRAAESDRLNLGFQEPGVLKKVGKYGGKYILQNGYIVIF